MGKSNKNRSDFGIVEVVLGIILVIVLSGAGWLVWSNKHKSTSAVKPATTQSLVSTAPGKYTSKLYPSLNFDLPEGWSVSEPTAYTNYESQTGLADGILTLSSGSAYLELHLSTESATGFEGYNCHDYSSVTKVGKFYRYLDKQGKLVYSPGISKADADWPKEQKEFYIFDDMNPTICIDYPFLGTHTSNVKRADYPDITYSAATNSEVLVWLSVSGGGSSNDYDIASMDKIINSLSGSVESL